MNSADNELTGFSSANGLGSQSVPGTGVGWRARFNGPAGLASPTPRFEASLPCSGLRALKVQSCCASTDVCKRPLGRQPPVPGSLSHQWWPMAALCTLLLPVPGSTCALSPAPPASALSLVAVTAGRRRSRWHGARELPAPWPQGDS